MNLSDAQEFYDEKLVVLLAIDAQLVRLERPVYRPDMMREIHARVDAQQASNLPFVERCRANDEELDELLAAKGGMSRTCLQGYRFGTRGYRLRRQPGRDHDE